MVNIRVHISIYINEKTKKVSDESLYRNSVLSLEGKRQGDSTWGEKQNLQVVIYTEKGVMVLERKTNEIQLGTDIGMFHAHGIKELKTK